MAAEAGMRGGQLCFLTEILDRGGTGTQPSGGSSVPKISAVPVTRRTRRGASGSTSTRSSLCGASLYCRGGSGAAAPVAAVAAAAMVKGFGDGATARVWASPSPEGNRCQCDSVKVDGYCVGVGPGVGATRSCFIFVLFITLTVTPQLEKSKGCILTLENTFS